MEVVHLAERLLEEPSPEHALSVARAHLDGLGFELERPVPGTLVAERGTGGVVLSGHVDVVPAGDGWSGEPFGTPVADGVLVGRGASDMRGPVAAMLAALEATTAPARLVLTTDEETTMGQARTLAAAGLVDDAPLVVVGEPTGLDVATCGKGVAWLELAVDAPQGHASTPIGPDGRGPSAAERLVELLAKLPHRPLPYEHAVLGPATAALTGLDTGGNPFNVLAGRALARIDCRFPSPGTAVDARDAVAAALGLPTDDASLTLEKDEPSFEGADAAAPRVVDALATAQVDARTIGVPYASEAGHWGPRAPTLVCGPGSIERAHAPDEFITVQELEAGVRAYVAILARFAVG